MTIQDSTVANVLGTTRLGKYGQLMLLDNGAFSSPSIQLGTGGQILVQDHSSLLADVFFTSGGSLIVDGANAIWQGIADEGYGGEIIARNGAQLPSYFGLLRRNNSVTLDGANSGWTNELPTLVFPIGVAESEITTAALNIKNGAHCVFSGFNSKISVGDVVYTNNWQADGFINIESGGSLEVGGLLGIGVRDSRSHGNGRLKVGPDSSANVGRMSVGNDADNKRQSEVLLQGPNSNLSVDGDINCSGLFELQNGATCDVDAFSVYKNGELLVDNSEFFGIAIVLDNLNTFDGDSPPFFLGTNSLFDLSHIRVGDIGTPGEAALGVVFDSTINASVSIGSFGSEGMLILDNCCTNIDSLVLDNESQSISELVIQNNTIVVTDFVECGQDIGQELEAAMHVFDSTLDVSEFHSRGLLCSENSQIIVRDVFDVFFSNETHILGGDFHLLGQFQRQLGDFEFGSHLNFGQGTEFLQRIDQNIPGAMDRLFVDGNFSAAGALTVQLDPGLEVSENQQLIFIFVEGKTSGEFIGLAEGAFVANHNNTDLFITYRAGTGNDVGLVTPLRVAPTKLEIFRGSVNGKVDLTQIESSDDEYICVEPGFVLFSDEPPVSLIATSQIDRGSPSSLLFTMESFVNAVELRQLIEVFNFNSNEYELLDERTALLADFSLDVEFVGNIEDYVSQNGNQLKTRISWKAPGFVTLFPWTVSIDHLEWSGH